MKKEFIWWVASALLSAFIVGIVTRFTFTTLDIQLHDTYYVVGSFDAIKLLAFILIFGRYVYWLTDLMTTRYQILTLLISIINPIVGLFVFIGTYLSIEPILTSRKIYPGMDLSVYLLLAGIFLGILTVQTIIEMKMISKLRALLAGK